ncbi:MAG: hypothetical protein ABI318_10110 [Chthoniobacteraceae bacterium]
MKLLIPLVAVGAAIFFGWKYTEAENARTAAEARTAEVTQQLDERTKELQALKAANARHPGMAGAGKSNLVEEKLRAWKNPLDGATGDKSQRPQGR